MNDKYVSIREISVEAHDFVCNRLFSEQFPNGRHELSDGMYVNIEEYTTKFRSDCCFEAHKKYIDIQIMLEGQELITVADSSGIPETEPYDDEKDVVFFDNNGEGVDFLLAKGDFLILTPEQAHMPCVCIGSRKEVRKAVIKVPLR